MVLLSKSPYNWVVLSPIYPKESSSFSVLKCDMDSPPINGRSSNFSWVSLTEVISPLQQIGVKFPAFWPEVTGDFGPTSYCQKTEVASLPTPRFDPLQCQQATSPWGRGKKNRKSLELPFKQRTTVARKHRFKSRHEILRRCLTLQKTTNNYKPLKSSRYMTVTHSNNIKHHLYITIHPYFFKFYVARPRPKS